MKTTRYQTDQRLWFCTTLVLFLVPWFLIRLPDYNGETTPAGILLQILGGCWDALVSVCHGELTVLDAAGVFAWAIGITVIFSAVCLPVSMLIGWPIHCALVVAREKIRKAKTHSD